MYRFHTVLAALTLTFAPQALQAREHQAGGWVTAALKGPLGPQSTDTRWQYLLHGEYRALDVLDGVRQSVLRTGVGYQLNDSMQLWGGYGFHRTHIVNGGTVNEHRIWQAFEWSTPLDNGWKLSTRSRLEERLFEGRSGVRWRFRQAVKLSMPSERHNNLTWIVGVEPFFAVHEPDGSSRGMGQNRTFAGLGIRTHDRFKWEIGYLNQWVRNRLGEDLVNHMLQVNLRFS